MSTPAATLDLMSKKQTPKTDNTKSPNRTPATVFNMRVDKEIGEAFKTYVDSLRPKIGYQQMVEWLMERFLDEVGARAMDRDSISPMIFGPQDDG